MKFANLAAFHFLWILPPVLVVAMIFRNRALARLQKIFGERLYPFLSSSVSVRKRKVKTILQVIALVFFVLALARPQMGQSLQEVKSEGVEVVIAADVSNSMLADDVKPSRLEQMKAEMNRLVELFGGNKVGVIAFAGNAVLLSPLTNDPGALKLYIDSLNIDSVTEQGTNFKSMLEMADEAFSRGGVTTDATSRVTRVVLIASDGEDQEPGAVEYAKKLTDKGIRIFGLAYGTAAGAPIPVRDQFGYLKGYKKDKSGQTVMTKVDGEVLKGLAAAGKGSFYHAVFGGDHLKKIVDDIGKLEKAEFSSTMATQYEEKFQLFLFVGVVLALIELFLNERRGVFKLWRGRFEVPPQ